jgi:hypothetical protein
VIASTQEVGVVGRTPIVYHPQYNIGFWGMENLHPFDAKKYGKVYDQLIKRVS